MVICDITANEAGHHYEEFIYFPLSHTRGAKLESLS
jgi:hypothetical protein